MISFSDPLVHKAILAFCRMEHDSEVKLELIQLIEVIKDFCTVEFTNLSFIKVFLSCFLSFKNVYYESIKRKLNKKLILDCRCDTRLKGKGEGSTHTLGDEGNCKT